MMGWMGGLYVDSSKDSLSFVCIINDFYHIAAEDMYDWCSWRD